MSQLLPAPAAQGAWTDASQRLVRAIGERDQLGLAINAGDEGAGVFAARRLEVAEERVAAQEAWLAWVELGY